jgi:phosphoglycolate phosphatase
MPPTTKTAKPTKLTATAKPVVVLFDVDETLVHTGGSGARSWKAAFDTLYGIPADIGHTTTR